MWSQAMFAVIESGGKQHKVKEGDVVRLEKLPAEIGSSVSFEKVLLVSQEDDVQIGAPYLQGKKVTGEVVAQTRGEKIKIVKFRRRKHSRTTNGHRQYYTDVKITGIE
jgi:large subunit ribosomal protein L21